MSNFFGTLKPGKATGDAPPVWARDMAVMYPTLAQCLEGNPHDTATMPKFEPMTLMVFARDGRLKFSLGSKDGEKTFFGLVDEFTNPWEAMEKAISDLKGEWVSRRGK